ANCASAKTVALAAYEICNSCSSPFSRSLMLMSILNECFGNLNWFGSIMKDEGETAVMVTETYPETPFFWAIQLSEVSQNKMVTLFTAIAKSEKNQPYLGKDDAHRGKKCLAEFLFTPHDAGAWNRACILEVVNFFALVFFVDFGSTAFIPIYSLKFLSEEEFWQIPPLTQPFMLEEGWDIEEHVHRALTAVEMKQQFCNLIRA
uniref:Tudor domain-containing protein n=1 Tax=Erpetoichthys calabaricus TaxID=27687 RepID=A0A8C4T3X2_ERPCA